MRLAIAGSSAAVAPAGIGAEVMDLPQGPLSWRAPRTLARMAARAAAVVVLALAAGCATPHRMAAVPASLTTRAQPAIPNSRFFVLRDPQPFSDMLVRSYAAERAVLNLPADRPLPPAAFLAISGGGDEGAFAAGLLTGWTEAGTRPTFKLVTGISTGALIAPFAFLGPRYDPALRETYTRITEKDIFKKRLFTAALFSDAMGDTTPMARTVARYITRDLLDEIAVEYAKGRILLVGTTNLDSREPIFWDMGAIASSRDPAALDLFRKITLASAAIPAAFPPVMIDVTVDGVRYQEMHVDGGASRQVFMYPRRVDLGKLTAASGAFRQRSVYIIRNARLDPDWARTDRRTLSIAGRSIDTLIQAQGMGDLYRMYLTCQRDGIDFNLTYIPADFAQDRKSMFDPVYMTKLFERGRAMALAGTEWEKAPPGYDPKAVD